MVLQRSTGLLLDERLRASVDKEMLVCSLA